MKGIFGASDTAQRLCRSGKAPGLSSRMVSLRNGVLFLYQLKYWVLSFKNKKEILAGYRLLDKAPLLISSCFFFSVFMFGCASVRRRAYLKRRAVHWVWCRVSSHLFSLSSLDNMHP
jgi:hypothetical protein